MGVFHMALYIIPIAISAMNLWPKQRYCLKILGFVFIYLFKKKKKKSYSLHQYFTCDHEMSGFQYLFPFLYELHNDRIFHFGVHQEWLGGILLFQVLYSDFPRYMASDSCISKALKARTEWTIDSFTLQYRPKGFSVVLHCNSFHVLPIFRLFSIQVRPQYTNWRCVKTFWNSNLVSTPHSHIRTRKNENQWQGLAENHAMW